MDVFRALPEAIKLDFDDEFWLQPVDYEKIPFRCRWCHEYKHFIRNIQWIPMNRLKNTLFRKRNMIWQNSPKEVEIWVLEVPQILTRSLDLEIDLSLSTLRRSLQSKTTFNQHVISKRKIPYTPTESYKVHAKVSWRAPTNSITTWKG